MRVATDQLTVDKANKSLVPTIIPSEHGFQAAYGFTYEVRLTVTWEEWDDLVDRVEKARAGMTAKQRKGRSW